MASLAIWGNTPLELVARQCLFVVGSHIRGPVRLRSPDTIDLLLAAHAGTNKSHMRLIFGRDLVEAAKPQSWHDGADLRWAVKLYWPVGLTTAFEFDRLLNSLAKLGEHVLVVADLLQQRTSIGTGVVPGKPAFERDCREVRATVVGHQCIEAHGWITARHTSLR